MVNEAGICGGCFIGMLILYLISIFIVSIDIIAILKYLLLGIFLIIIMILCLDIEPKPKKNYIYCKKCVRYYALEDGEIPENFEKKCYCGEVLEFYETLEEIQNLKNN